MNHKNALISDPNELKELVDHLNHEKMIGFDTEFIRETTFFPRLELIQIATRDEAWIIDVQTFMKKSNGNKIPKALDPLIELFQNKKILKILHAALADQECLFTTFGITATPTLDTAVAASVCGYGDSVGLGNLLRSVLDVKIKKGHARTDWGKRPLATQLVDYALSDVIHLVTMAEKLLEELNRLGRREWALELSKASENGGTFELTPEMMAENLNKSGKVDETSYPVLLELIRWRESRVRELNIPKRWLADDGTLVDLARVKPRDLKHLSSFRGINKGEMAKSGENILKAIEKGLSDTLTQAPARQRFKTPSTHETQIAGLLKCFVGILAEENRIAPRHLVSGDQIYRLIRNREATIAELVKEGILEEKAARLVGEAILEFLNGKKGLTITNSEVTIISR